MTFLQFSVWSTYYLMDSHDVLSRVSLHLQCCIFEWHVLYDLWPLKAKLFSPVRKFVRARRGTFTQNNLTERK